MTRPAVADRAPAAAVSRAAVAGLAGFGLAALLLGGILGAAAADWTPATALAVGAGAAALGGAAGGLAGAWQARAAGLRGPRSLLAATLGPCGGALLLLASAPQASLATLAGLAAVVAGALTAARLSPRAPRR